MAQLTIINDAFDRTNKNTFFLKNDDIGKPLYLLFDKYIKEFNNKAYDIVFSVNGMVVENLGIKLLKDDHVSIVPIPAGGGEGGSKNILRMVAVIALSVVTAGAGTALAAGMGFTGTALTIAGAVFQAGIMIAGGLLINAIFPVQTPSLSNNNSNLESSSPTYSFNGGSNARTEGTSIPIILGKVKIVPPVIASYLSAKDDKQHLNMLFAVNDDKFDEVHSININNQDSNNYSNVLFDTRYGTVEQTPINTFSDNILTVSQGIALNEGITTTEYTTNSNAINRIDVALTLPNGLFSVQDDGTYASKSITASIYYRINGEAQWILSQNVNIQGVYKTSKRFVYNINNLEQNRYDIKIVRTSNYDANTRVANSFQFEYINEITYDDLAYPCTGLVSVDALATDQLNGSFPQVSMIIENKYLRYWEGNVLIEDTNKRLDNPAWATYYILRKAGFTNEHIKLSDFQSWATYCEEKEYVCNLVLDQTMELPEMLNIISPLGRAKIVQFGTKWGCIVDKPVSLPTQSFLFTNGNIIESSFSLDYIPYTDRANVVEVTYYDENNDYQASTVQAQSIDFDATSDEYKTSINLYGCTKKQMAANYANFLIRNNKYITETVNFTAAIDSLACNVGDVIKVGVKYFTNNIADGRIVSDTNGIIVLDEKVQLEVGKTYSIDIRNSIDDTLHSVDMSSITEDTYTDTITLLNPLCSFDKHDVYSFGETNKQTNLYRVLNISRDSEFKRKISAIEYIPEVYDDELIVPDEEVYIIEYVRGLTAIGNTIKSPDGTIIESISITWEGAGLSQNVFINGERVGISSTNSFTFKDAVKGEIYRINVGDKEIYHTYEGNSLIPTAPQNPIYSSSNGNLNISWERNDDIDFYQYLIEFNGKSYKTFTNNFTFYDLDIGTYTAYLYAINTIGTKSEQVILQAQVTDLSLANRLRDSALLEQAFADGIMTLWLGTTPASPKDYDIHIVSLSSLTLGEYTYVSKELETLTWGDFDATMTYKYYLKGKWFLCDAQQITVVARLLKYVNYQAISDGNVRVFSKQPAHTQRYDIGDLWIKSDGTLMECIQSNYEEA